jgi:hypothetical protein
MLEPSGDTGEKDSNIDRQDVQDRIPISIPVTEPPAAEPILPVAPVIPVSAPIPEPVAFVVSEPESAIVEPVIDTSPTQAPVVPEIIPEPVPVVVEPLPTEMSVVEPSPVPEPIEPIAVVPSVTSENLPCTNGDGLPAVATPQALQAGTSPSTLATEPVPVDIEVATQIPETPHPDPLPQGARENIIFQGEPDGTPPSTTAPEQESPLTNQ